MRRNYSVCVLASILVLFLLTPIIVSSADISLFFPPEWVSRAAQSKEIADTLSKSSGLTIQPVIAQTYTEIITNFSRNRPVLVYVGSFLQAILYNRDLSVPMLQGIDGKEFYTSIMIAPNSAGSDPIEIAKTAGSSVAYAKGTSSGESGAKAATGGIATVGTASHYSAVFAVKTGNAKCAFVKDSWWNANKDKFNGMNQFAYPGVSDKKNPDNVLTANKVVSAADLAKIKSAVIANAKVFQVKSFKEFDPALLDPSIALMKKGNINPKTYTW